MTQFFIDEAYERPKWTILYILIWLLTDIFISIIVGTKMIGNSIPWIQVSISHAYDYKKCVSVLFHVNSWVRERILLCIILFPKSSKEKIREKSNKHLGE